MDGMQEGSPQEEASESPAQEQAEMDKAIGVIHAHNTLMKEKPALHKKALTHYKKHGMKKKISSMDDLKTAAKNAGATSANPGPGYDAGG